MKKLIFIHFIFAVTLLIGQFALYGQSLAKPNPKKNTVSSEQKKEIEAIIREYLIKNPKLLREVFAALEQQEEKEKMERASFRRKERSSDIYFDPDSPVAGNPKGDVTIVVFFDYFCSYCKKTLPELNTLLAKDSSLRVIYKEFPILSAESVIAAKFALAANRQGKYTEFHNALLKTGVVSDEVMKSIADNLGINYATLRKDMEDPAIKLAIDRNYNLAEAIGIDGTPAYLIGEKLIPGAVNSTVLTKLITEERARMAATKVQ